MIFHLCFQFINLSKNSIRSMKGLQNHSLLQEIELEENQVSGIILKYHSKLGNKNDSVLLKYGLFVT